VSENEIRREVVGIVLNEAEAFLTRNQPLIESRKGEKSMKKLLIASLVLGMLIVFSGIANATVSYWWQSSEITTPITVTYLKTSKGNEVLSTVTGKFKGWLVVNSSTETVPTVVDEVFLCGTFTVDNKAPFDVDLNFSPATAFSFLSSSYATLPTKGKFDIDLGDVIAVGTFTGESAQTGPVYLTGKVTLKVDDTGTIDSVTVNGGVVGGYSQGATESGMFSSPSISAVLTTPGTTALTCSGGTVQ